MKLVDGMLLYHGSYVPVEKINLDKCAIGKDFGQGFYLTADKQQAENFIKTSLLKAKARNLIPKSQNHGFVTCYKYHKDLEDIPIFEFPDANTEWLWFVSLNRRSRLAETLATMIDKNIFSSEIIIGKIVNDTTNPVITAYLNGLYGAVSEGHSAQMAISLLLPHKLKDQYCFLSQRAINCLELVEVYSHEL